MTDKEVITKALEFLDKEYDTYPSAEEWRQALRDILNSSNSQPAREKFYSSDLNTDRAEENLVSLIKNCTLQEVLWIMRNIIYDQVSYYSADSHSPIYDEDRDKLNIEQANRFQQQLSTLLDLFGQSIIDKRVFHPDYLSNYEFAAPYIKALDDLRRNFEE